MNKGRDLNAATLVLLKGKPMEALWREKLSSLTAERFDFPLPRFSPPLTVSLPTPQRRSHFLHVFSQRNNATRTIGT